MEASEKLRFSREATVRVLDERLVIEHLAVDDERAARVVRERVEAGQRPADTVAKAIEIGARVIDSEGTAANVDYVRAEFGRHAGELAERLGKVIEVGNDVLAEEIAKSFGADRQGTVQAQIKELLDRSAESQREAISRQFSAQDGSNPLFDFKDAVVREVQGLKAAHERQREEDRRKLGAMSEELVALRERLGAKEEIDEERERGTAKGRTFEDRVHLAIEQLAEGRGDAAFHVGDERGKGGTKKGDTVVELDAAGGSCATRIVFEAKDKKLSKRAAWDELNDAMAEREADFAILVVAGEDHVPAGREQLHEYEGNKLIVAVDPDEPDGLGLDLAYRYARCRLVLLREGETEMDAPAVRSAAEEALSSLRQAQSIKLALKKAEGGVDEARTGLEQMAAEVKLRLERIEMLAAG
jgi:hypothetical protein